MREWDLAWYKKESFPLLKESFPLTIKFSSLSLPLETERCHFIPVFPGTSCDHSLPVNYKSFYLNIQILEPYRDNRLVVVLTFFVFFQSCVPFLMCGVHGTTCVMLSFLYNNGWTNFHNVTYMHYKPLHWLISFILRNLVPWRDTSNYSFATCLQTFQTNFFPVFDITQN